MHFREVRYLVLFLLISTAVFGKSTIEVDSHFKSVQIGANASFFACKNGCKEVPSASTVFSSFPDKLLYFENSQDVWVSFQLHNSDSIPKSLVVEINNPLLDEISFYLFDNNQEIYQNHTGDQFQFNSRPVAYRTFLYPFVLKSNAEYKVLFRSNADGRKMHIPMTVYTEAQFIEKSAKKDMLLGWYYGILAALTILYFYLAYILKDKTFLFFAIYLFSLTLTQLATSGVDYAYLWPETTYMNNRALPLFMSFSLFVALIFSKIFLNKITKNWINVLLSILQAVVLMSFITSFGNDYLLNFSMQLLYSCIPVVYSIMFAIGIFYLINQFKSARFFVLSFFAAIFSIAVMNYYAFATTNDNVFTNNLVIFAVLLKCILLSIAMLDRLKIFKEEKELAQATVISQLQELSDMRAEVNLELEKKVQEKTTELYKKQKEAKLALITGEENERKRIATELHDGLGGLLSTLKLNAESLELENKTHTKAYSNVLFLIDKACQELRLLSHNMLPSGIEHLGIELTLKSYIDKLSSGINKPILLDTYGLESIRNKSLELHVYRICSELINNAIKHSQFKNLNVQLIKQNQTLTIIVADDGIGFDPFDTAHSGIGFISIRSRLEALAGDMKVDSLIGKGTTIIIEIPTE